MNMLHHNRRTLNLTSRCLFGLILCAAIASFSPVQAAEVPPLEEVVSVVVDAPTIERGYTHTSSDGRMRVGIRPGTLHEGTQIDVKTLHPSLMQDTLTSFSEAGHWRMVGSLYLFDILKKSSYDGKDFFFLEIRYPEGDVRTHPRHLVFFNAVSGLWEPLPSEDHPELSAVRALIHLPYARLAIVEEEVMSIGKASWYGYKGCLCAASPDYPKGTRLKVTLVSDPARSVEVVVNDYGPNRTIHPDRVIDLDKVAFQKLLPLGAGLTEVRVEPVE